MKKKKKPKTRVKEERGWASSSGDVDKTGKVEKKGGKWDRATTPVRSQAEGPKKNKKGGGEGEKRKKEKN